MEREAIDRADTNFALLDVDHNGYLEASDFRVAANRIADAVDAEEGDKEALRTAVRRWWTTISEDLDADRDGRVSP